MIVMFGAKQPQPTPTEPDEGVVLMGLDSDHLKRLALQGQRGPAAELARRSKAQTVTEFFEEVLTKVERERLTGGQFNVLADSLVDMWRGDARLKDTVELPAVKGSNLNKGWKETT